jgi:tetratricopeptide (TPR) repeat protein
MLFNFFPLFWVNGGQKEELFEEGEKLFGSRAYKGAEEIFRKIVQDGRDNPFYPKALLRLAQCYLAMGNYEEAEKHFKLFLEEFPHSPRASEALYFLARTYLLRWRMKEAIDILNKFLQFYTEDDLITRVLLTLADCYEHLYDFPMAIETYERLNREFSRYSHEVIPLSLLRLGHCYLQLGKIGKAVEAWKALEDRLIPLEEVREKVPILESISEKLYGSLGVFRNDLQGTVSLPHLISLYSKMPEKVPPFVEGPLPEPALVGPMREAGVLSLRGLLIVYGSQGEEEDNEATRNAAFERKKWMEEIVRFTPEVKSDIEVREDDMKNKQIYLIGNANCNRIIARIMDDLPIKLNGKAVIVGDRVYGGEKMGAIFALPNPLNNEKYVQLELAVSPRDFFPRLKAVPCWNVDYAVLEAREPDNLLLEEGFFIKPSPRSWKVLSKSGESM